MRTYGTSETFNVTPSRIVNIIMLNMLVGMKDSNVKYVINDLAASQDKKSFSENDKMPKYRNRPVIFSVIFSGAISAPSEGQ